MTVAAPERLPCRFSMPAAREAHVTVPVVVMFPVPVGRLAMD